MSQTKWLTILLCSLALLIACGCQASASSGNSRLQADAVAQIHKGTTTRAEVEAMLGTPDHVALLPDGRRVMFYVSGQSQFDYSGTMIQSLVPFAAFVPGSNSQKIRRKSLQVYLNAGNIVQDYEFSDNTTEQKTTASAFGAHAEETNVSNTPSDGSGH